MSILIKNAEVLESLFSYDYDPLLAKIITNVLKSHGGVITEGWRKSRHSDDLHATDPVRAIDLRSVCYPAPSRIVDEINQLWSYDYNRPHLKVALLHKIDGEGEHIHVQVHPATKKFDDFSICNSDKWQDIASAPCNVAILLKGNSGLAPPNDTFIINGYRDLKDSKDDWRDIVGTPLKELNWIPTHWKVI